MVMNIIGAAATRLKARLDLIYEVREDGDGRVFSGLHETSSHFLPCQDPFFNSCVDHALSEANDQRVPT